MVKVVHLGDNAQSTESLYQPPNAIDILGIAGTADSINIARREIPPGGSTYKKRLSLQVKPMTRVSFPRMKVFGCNIIL